MKYFGYKTPKIPRFSLKRRIMEKQHLKTFFKSFNKNDYFGFYYYSLFKLLFNTGMRVGEAFEIKIQDIDLEQSGIYISKGKNSKPHYYPISKTFHPELIDWINYIKNIYPNTPYLFPTFNKSNKKRGQNAWEYFKKQLEQASLSNKYSPHSLRRTIASYMEKNGTPIEAISSILNHSTVDQTRTYIYTSPDILVEEITKSSF